MEHPSGLSLGEVIGITVAAGLAGRLSAENTVPEKMREALAQALVMLGSAIGDMLHSGTVNLANTNQGLMILCTESQAHAVCIDLPRFSDPSDSFWADAPKVDESELWAITHSFLDDGNVTGALGTAVLQFGVDKVRAWADELKKEGPTVPILIILTVMRPSEKPDENGTRCATVGGFATLTSVARIMLDAAIAEGESVENCSTPSQQTIH